MRSTRVPPLCRRVAATVEAATATVIAIAVVASIANLQTDAPRKVTALDAASIHPSPTTIASPTPSCT